jgi:hypothetical protein
MRSNDTERVRGREAYVGGRLARVETELDPEERIVADRHPQVVVSDRRCFLVRGRASVGGRTWELDGVRFDEVVEWREGRTHDERPIVRMAHAPHARQVHVPRHRFLWFEWGNAEAAVPVTTTEVRCSSRRDPTYRALVDGLHAAVAPRGPSFQEFPEGTREERTRASTGLLTRGGEYTARRTWLSRMQRRVGGQGDSDRGGAGPDR